MGVTTVDASQATRIEPQSEAEERLLRGLQQNAGHFLDATHLYPRRVTHHIYRILRRWHREGLVEQRTVWRGWNEQRDTWRLAEGNPALIHDAFVTQVQDLHEQRARLMERIAQTHEFIDEHRAGAQEALAMGLGTLDDAQQAWEAANDWTQGVRQLWQLHESIARLGGREATIRERAESAGLDAEAIVIGRAFGGEPLPTDGDPLAGDA